MPKVIWPSKKQGSAVHVSTGEGRNVGSAFLSLVEDESSMLAGCARDALWTGSCSCERDNKDGKAPSKSPHPALHKEGAKLSPLESVCSWFEFSSFCLNNSEQKGTKSQIHLLPAHFQPPSYTVLPSGSLVIICRAFSRKPRLSSTVQRMMFFLLSLVFSYDSPSPLGSAWPTECPPPSYLCTKTFFNEYASSHTPKVGYSSLSLRVVYECHKSLYSSS